MRLSIDRMTSLLSFTRKNAIPILTATSVVGVFTTAVLAAEGHLKAQDIRYEVDPDSRGRTVCNMIRSRIWCYAPCVVSATMTVMAIVANSRTSAKRIAALSVAYAASEASLDSIKKAAIEAVGEKKVAMIEEMAAVDQMKRSGKELVMVNSNEILCYDTFTGRYFSSTMENIRRAANDVNAKLVREDACSLNEFYSAVGISEVSAGDDLGWNVDTMCDVVFGTSLSEDGKPCLAISFRKPPIPVWWRRG